MTQTIDTVRTMSLSSSTSSSSIDRTTAVDSIQLSHSTYNKSVKEKEQQSRQQQGINEQLLIIELPKEEIDILDDTPTTKKQRRWMLFKRITYIVIMNAALPIGLYYILKPHIAAVWALVLSSTPTIISVIVQAIFMRRVDSIGVAVIFGFILSVILAVVNGDPKLLLMRESFVTAGVGIVCAITLIPIRIKSFVLKPVLFYISRDLIPLPPVHFLDGKPPQSRMEFYWQYSSYCRYHYRVLTAIDIVILELEFGLKLFYILRFELDTVVVLSNTTLSVIGIVVSVGTIWCIVRIRRRLRKDEVQMLENAQAKIGV